MKCRGFGEEYIGEAGNFLRKKATIHNQHIRDPQTRMIKVSEHIDICAKKCITNIQVTRFVRCTQTVQIFDGQKNNVHKCIKAKTKQNNLDIGVTHQDYLNRYYVNSLLCTERYHNVAFSLLEWSLNLIIIIIFLKV